ncbi:glycosyltransferase family 2 protein [Aeromonas veronii]|uniref:glycosyltransferase n=1 Tax=Aeromonas veronii TaxID=654 RepID=UPI00403D8822
MTQEVVTSGAQNHFARYSYVESELIVDGCQPKMLPDLSVMIPTFRRPQLLKEAIESVVNQTAHGINIEIVIVDNDAEKNSTELIALIESFFPNNIRLFRNKENIGMFGNWNRCIELARSPILTILNDDDLLHPEFIKKMCCLAKCSAISVEKVRFQKNIDFSRLKIKNNVRSLTLADFFVGNPINGSLGFVFSKLHALELGGYNPELWPTADYDFSYRYFERFGIQRMSAQLAGYRWLENESMNLRTLEGFLANDIAFRRGVIGKRKVSKFNSAIMSVLIDLMALSASFFYETVNKDFNTMERLSDNKVRTFWPVVLYFMRNRYTHRVFLLFLRFFCKRVLV